MSQSIEDRVRWTTADIELLPDNGDRYEIIDGELFVTKYRIGDTKESSVLFLPCLTIGQSRTS
jgi:hypothetical protein